jgi:GntR family transcriptional regulator / MocR family aminotransferase
LRENGPTTVATVRMTAVNPLFEIELDLPARGARNIAGSLYRQLKAAIVDGRLPPGERLPATRRSAQFLRVSRSTAVEVYERLMNEGYLVSVRGSGTYVADRLPVLSSRVAARHASGPDPRISGFWTRPEVTDALGFWQDRPARRSGTRASAGVDFRPALVDSRLFPFAELRQVLVRQLRGLQRRPPSYRSAQGHQGNHHLREATARHIAVTRAVVCDPDEILICSGAQQAFDLLARVLVKGPQTVVAVEDPGYPPMRVAFGAAGAKIVPVGVDTEGLILEDIPERVSVICVCPSHQFPLGMTMSARRRQALIELARARGAVIVEDDYDGEFRYDGTALQALRSTDTADVVFYVGTFSKCMLPALRLGYLVAPDWALRALVLAKNCLDWHCSTPTQLAVCGFMADGHLSRHIRRMRHIYAERRAALLASLREEFGDWLQVVPSLYGMHITALARTPAVDLEEVTAELLTTDIKLHTLRRYYLGPQGRQGLVFGFGTVDRAGIALGLAALSAAYTPSGRRG